MELQKGHGSIQKETAHIRQFFAATCSQRGMYENISIAWFISKSDILFFHTFYLKTGFPISPHFLQSRHLEPAPSLPCRRSVGLMALVMAVHGVWILENPASTLIHESKWFQWLLRATAKYGIKAPQSIFDVFIL